MLNIAATPGPGEYETNDSSVVSQEFMRKKAVNPYNYGSNHNLISAANISTITKDSAFKSINTTPQPNVGFGSSAGKGESIQGAEMKRLQ